VVLRTEVIFEVDKALLEFNDIAMRFRNFYPVLRGRMDKAVRDYLYRRFHSNGNGEWAPLNPSYASFKRARGARKRTLQYSGEMMEAFTAIAGHPHQILVLENNLYVRTVDEEVGGRARGHQRGYSPAQPRLPRRAIIPDEFPTEFIDKLKNIVRDYVIRGDR